MITALREHWPEYLMELANVTFLLLGLAALLAFTSGGVSALSSPQIPPEAVRLIRALLTGVLFTLLIHSPWGKQSGGHMNPAMTFAFFSVTVIFFRAESFADAWTLLAAAGFQGEGREQLDWRLSLLIGALGALHFAGSLSAVQEMRSRIPWWLYAPAYGALAALALSLVPMRSEPFIYFQF